MTEHWFLSRADQDKLCELLDSIPGLVDDLTITLTRQDKLGSGPRVSRGDEPPPLPFNEAASTAADTLYAELCGWVRMVCEQRRMVYEGDDSLMSVARWLKRWIIALAMTEGSQTAYVSISRAFGACRRAVDRKPVTVPVVDAEKLGEARRLLLNARGIAVLARELGDSGKGLSQSRVQSLKRAGRICGVYCDVFTRAEVFEVGAVLDAHAETPSVLRAG